ncbi:MAG: hypothetical protein KDA78_20260, partial [Planctomycetaceae bacterium]|nr:hypothetical protein [Planctomycetaceae bacterium]
MKRFLACATLAFTLSGLTGLSWGDEPETAGRVRLTDESSAPPPIPHVIGEDDEAGRTVLNGSGSPLPEMAPVYAETFNAPNIGYQMSGDIFTVQYRIDQRNGGLYGYDDGYTNIGAFIPRAISDSSLLFWDVRGMATNNSDGGFNVGFGRRRYSPSGDRVYSQSLWLDYDGGHWNQYLQVGGSWSMTSRYWRTRVNYNQLISDQDDFVGATVYNPTPLFENNNIVIGRQRTKEVAFNHFDATVGGPIPILGRYGMNWDFGLYTDFSRAGQDGIGFLAHVDANLTEDILADVRYTNDDIWGSSAQLSFVFNLPDGRPSRMMRQPRVHDYMLRPDERNYRVSTKQYLCDDTLPLLCTTTNAPLTVAHIDPFAVDNVLPDGDGSFENPFNSTAAWNALTGAEKAAFDIVLVRPGTTAEGNIHDNNLNSGIVIVENQRLLASTGRFVREVGTNGLDLIRIAPHMVTADVAGYTTGTTFAIPGA